MDGFCLLIVNILNKENLHTAQDSNRSESFVQAIMADFSTISGPTLLMSTFVRKRRSHGFRCFQPAENCLEGHRWYEGIWSFHVATRRFVVLRSHQFSGNVEPPGHMTA